jgi:hypothetical protein
MRTLETSFRVVEAALPRPTLKVLSGGTVARFAEQTAHQAALQKTARYISGLTALILLLSHGFLQEQGVLQRTLDEISEDVFFLVLNPFAQEDQELKARYLASFYQEEFEDGVPAVDSTRRRDQIPRRKIRASINRQTGQGPLGLKAASILVQTYSGYVHAASPHIMEMYSIEKSQFLLSGVMIPHFYFSHVEDSWNYFYRGLLTEMLLALAAGKLDLYRELDTASRSFAKIMPN